MKYKVKVEFQPDSVEYVAEVDATSSDDAERQAANKLYEIATWYQGTDNGNWNFDTEQITAMCAECDVELPVSEIEDEMCPACYARYDTQATPTQPKRDIHEILHDIETLIAAIYAAHKEGAK